MDRERFVGDKHKSRWKCSKRIYNNLVMPTPMPMATARRLTHASTLLADQAALAFATLCQKPGRWS